MAKIRKSASTGKFELSPKSGSCSATITDKKTGRTLLLKGYGAMKGEFAVRKGIDLTKPIAAQAAKLKSPRKA